MVKILERNIWKEEDEKDHILKGVVERIEEKEKAIEKEIRRRRRQRGQKEEREEEEKPNQSDEDLYEGLTDELDELNRKEGNLARGEDEERSDSEERSEEDEESEEEENENQRDARRRRQKGREEVRRREEKRKIETYAFHLQFFKPHLILSTTKSKLG